VRTVTGRRLGALAAVAAGSLRIVTSFWLPASHVSVETLYLLVDLLILFGVMGLYAARSAMFGPVGLTGFVIATAGAATIVGPDGSIGSVGIYPVGSLTLSIGLVILGGAAWKHRTLPGWVPVLWAMALASGVAGAISGRERLFQMAGLMFGAAFVGAGISTWRAAR
jgi:hypothetical protein